MHQTFPKPEARTRTKARKARQDAKQLRAFRQVVWARERAKLSLDSAGAYCQYCGLMVVEPSSGIGGCVFGEVHHRIGRRAKASRYDPDNGVLLCGVFGNNCHGRAQRHEIDV